MQREVWTILLALLGVNLWALLCALPLQLEWVVEDTRGLVVAAYLLPLIFLLGGLLLRWPSLLLGLFPASFAPIWLVLPEADRMVHTTGSGWASLATSMVLFVCVGAAWLQKTTPRGLPGLPTPDQNTPTARSGDLVEAEPTAPPRLRHHLWWPYRMHFPPRWLFLALLLAVPLYGLNFADGVHEQYILGFGGQADHAQVMANLGFAFMWVVVAYLFFYSPGLNLELEQRELDIALQRIEDRAARAPRGWFFAAATVAGAALMAALLVWRSG